MADPHRHHHDRNHHFADSLEELRAALTADFWDQRYAASDRVWSGNPNARLVEQVADLKPGRALDVACGEGGDAIWLAEHGWEVTAVDVSPVALARVGEHSRSRGVTVATSRWDALEDAVPGGRPSSYELVTVSFLHVPEPDFAGIYQRISQAVVPGGRLLVTGHHPDDVESGVRRPHGDGLLFEPSRVLDAVAADSGWDVEVADAPTRVQDGPDGPMEVRDTVVRLRRR